MEKICIIIPYYGELPKNFNSFLKTCEKNDWIDWLLFTDENNANKYCFPSNVYVHIKTFNEIKELASKRIGFNVCLETPYKLCDYKVAYGLIFKEFIKNYTWWGYGDLDVLYGNLKNFLTSERMERYDKINFLGHLSLIRNTDECMRAFMLDVDKTMSYKECFTHNGSYAFDEKSINKKMMLSGLRVDDSVDFCERCMYFRGFKLVEPMEYEHINIKELANTCTSKNHSYQLIVWQNEGIFQYWLEIGGKIKKKEFSYIHHRLKTAFQMSEQGGYFTETGVEPLPPEGVTAGLIKKNSRSRLWEWYEIVIGKRQIRNKNDWIAKIDRGFRKMVIDLIRKNKK